MTPDHKNDEEDGTENNPITTQPPQPQPQPQERDTQHQNQLNSALGSSQQQHYYLRSVDRTVVIRQLPSQGLSFKLWPAATTLVTLLDQQVSHPAASPLFATFSNLDHCQSRPLRILELGSGTGLAGISASAVLGARVTVTDLPHVLPNLQFNVVANADVVAVRDGAVQVASLRWGEAEDMEATGKDYDLIIGSDVVYHDHLYDPLLCTLKFLLGGEKKTAFVMAHLKRWKKESTFFKKANKLFDVGIIHTDNPLDGHRVGVAVYRFVGKEHRIRV